MQSEAQRRAVDKYQKANYEYIKVRLNKGQKEIIRQQAEASGMGINQYCLNKLFK